MGNKTLGRVSSRIAAIAALSVMAVGGLASASQAYPAPGCDEVGFGCTSGGYGKEHLGADYAWVETRFGVNYLASIDIYDGHNCTRYAAFRLAANGMAEPSYSLGGPERWDDNVRAHNPSAVNGDAAVGAIAQWDWGHVSYVEAVAPDGSWIDTTEDNFNSNHTTSERIYAGTSAWPDHFIHLQDLLVVVDAPSIDGNPQVGEELTAVPATFTPAASVVAYQWYSNGAKIDGATDGTYRLTQSDIGKDITVTVTGSAPGRGFTPATSAAKTVTANVFEGMAIANVLGVPHVGNVLSADLDTAMTGIVPKYQWMHGNAEIDGATQQEYTVPATDISLPLRVAITLTSPGYADKTVISGYTAAVEPAGVVMSAVTVSGTPQVDQTLTANVTVTTQGATVGYQWFRNGFPISGAQGPTYRLTASDVGTSITVTVTGSKTTYDTTYRTSGPVTGALASISMSGVSIGSTARVGVTLYSSVSVSTAGASVGYQWYRNGTTLVGTGSYYTPTIYDNGAVISLNVTVSKAGYATAYRNSAGVSVAPALMGTFYATIQGTNRVEYTLSASVTSATAGVALTYYWKRGSTVVSTGTSYTLQPADIGQSITLTVVGTKAGYATSTTVAGAGTTAGYLGYSFSGSPAAISGTAKVGRVLTAVSALQTSGVSITYRWYRNGSPISATGRTYTLVTADKGKKMTVRIYFDKLGHQATSYLSAATATVVA